MSAHVAEQPCFTCLCCAEKTKTSLAHSFLFVQKWSLQHRPLNGVGGVPRLHLLHAA